MTIKLILTSLALAALPALSYASCSAHEHQTQSCAPGTTWDSASKSCVKQASS